MTIGDRIQCYRKQKEMSQEDLAARLLVSRQTVSQWEKGQTVPTVDNLLRLRDIFGVSLDNLVDDISQGEEAPREVYRFSYSEADWREAYRVLMRCSGAQITVLIGCLIGIVIAILTMEQWGVFLFFACYYILLMVRSRQAARKSITKQIQKALRLSYEYRMYRNYFLRKTYREDELLSMQKVYYHEIQTWQRSEHFFFFVVDGRLHLFPNESIPEYSPLRNALLTKQLTVKPRPKKTKLDIAAMLLCGVSAVTILPAFLSVVHASSAIGDYRFALLLFFAFLPIPLSLVAIGVMLKRRQNLRLASICNGIGISVAILLCIFGSMGIFSLLEAYL